MRLRVTQAEAWALGAGAILAAVDNSGAPDTVADIETSERGRSLAFALMVQSGLTPTQIKDLGLRVIGEANRAH